MKSFLGLLGELKDGKLILTPAGEQIAGFVLTLGFALLSKTPLGGFLKGGKLGDVVGGINPDAVILAGIEKLPKKWQGFAQAGAGLVLKYGGDFLGGNTGEPSNTTPANSGSKPGTPVVRP